ncbi:M20/M25/M40 family metallo-hydrolase [Actinosynnema sp. NPDC047251]|uniref:N-acetyl-ornithine/N-acetyl-lysine deacetylase n=1 Tax=Saccharothrix espanaensis (strain ATCC 51144 / DSM 44229 / JCM 9112 / NBRC 15066 / NRRL 15764) TaxID=1179773 RepID=K0K8D0_SACES|nr:M20/M25/M40 family metallo-hydrolase [Saccharothrix espanaensis]CCH32928.1 N-acetyl-ornithine/N-acetyl-lysine deacetylase [Saccharothrix espanaensis DSM 44229]
MPAERNGPVLDDAYAAALLRSLLEIPSPSYAEAALAGHLLSVLRELGFAARLDEVGNVIGELDRGPGPTVMLLGHLDTVPGTRPVRLTGGRLYGRGAVDAKGPLAAMVCAAVRATAAAGRIVLAAVVEEETPGSRGAVQIRKHHPPPDALIVGEPSGWSDVVLGYKGKLDLRYRVETPPTHPSNPEPKAGELAALAWTVLLELLGPEAGHGTFGHPGATLVSFVGDLTAATAEFSVRTPPDFDVERCVHALRERVGAGELSVVNAVAACRVRRTDPVVRALSAAIRGLGGRAGAKVKTATSDMNTLAEVWDIPMATYGPGDSRLDHHDDEHLELAEFFRGIEVLTAAVTDLSRSDAV